MTHVGIKRAKYRVGEGPCQRNCIKINKNKYIYIYTQIQSLDDFELRVLIERRVCLAHHPPEGSLQLSNMEKVSLPAREPLHYPGKRLFEQPSRFPWKRCWGRMSWWGQLPLCWEKRLPASLKCTVLASEAAVGFSQQGLARRPESWP